MKTKSTLFLFFICLVLSLSSCFTPRPVLRVEPIAEADKWNYGQAIVEAQKEDIMVSTSFAYSDPDFLIFDIEVTNWSEDRILVDPKDISLQLGELGYDVSAIDPERHMLRMELDASRREANAKNAAVVAGVVTVAAVTAAVVSSSGNDNNNNNNNGEQLLDAGLGVVNVAPTVIIGAGASIPPNEMPLTVDPWFWSDYTLRKTTLEKGQQVRGKVLFPRNDEMRDFELLVPVESLSFTFGFRQRLFRP